MAHSEAPRAYSYIRFSTPQQASGDSLARQTAKAAKWAAEKGLMLDTQFSLKDLGVSAYRRTNAQKGALGEFLRAVSEGLIPRGSYLLIENMDRLTRAEIISATGLFIALVGAGIIVVTLTNGEVYSQERFEREPWAMHIIVAELTRANQESARKSQMVGDQKAGKKQKLIAGELKGPYTRQTPAWLRWNDDTSRYELIHDRADIVREIFERADRGEGIDGIARALNDRGEPTWGTKGRKSDHWRGSYMRKILTSTAPIGTFTPHTSSRDPVTGARKDIPMDPVANLFPPAVVDEELYWRVRRRFETTAPRGKNAEREPKSIVAGIIKCATCGGPITRVSKGQAKGRYVYLLCSRANMKAKGCKNLPVSYTSVAERLCECIKGLVEDAPRGQNTAEIDRQIEMLKVAVDGLAEHVSDLADLAAEERNSVAARTRLREAEAVLRGAEAQLRTLVAQRDTLTTASVKARLKAVKDALTASPINVAAANQALRQAVRSITVDPETAMLSLTWHHAP
jgi:DNA invertase Pin-like site-specific DNA recombinase